MLLKTNGLHFDDRVRKESETLSSLGHTIKILAHEEANIAQQGESGGVFFKTLHLASVDFFAKSKGQIFKAIELFWWCFIETLRTRPHTLWLHCREFFYFLPLAIGLRKIGLVERVIWDQHELPRDRWLATRIGRILMSYWARKVDKLIFANESRRKIVEGHLSIPPGKSVVLENRADLAFATAAGEDLPAEVVSWLGSSRFFLAQGGAAPRRRFRELISAIGDLPWAKLIVIGGSAVEEIERFREEYDWFDDRVLLVGMVPQFEIVGYLDRAVASIVLYENCSDNNWLCAPNRMFQAAARGTPLLVGANPPMAQFIERTGGGIVLSDDGGDSIGLARAINHLFANEMVLREQALRHRRDCRWEEQQEQLIEAIGEPRPEPDLISGIHA